MSQDINNSPIPNYPSPNIATFNTYGVIPVDLYTGTPNIEIPIYTIKDNKVNIPINLKYNHNNVKPNTHPGVTGLGWNLFAGGSITRIERGNDYDEDSFNDMYDPYHPYKFIEGKKYGFLGNESRLADNWATHPNFNEWPTNVGNSQWYSQERLKLEAETSIRDENDKFLTLNYNLDKGSDKYIFNFLNYSGAFYRDHTGKWIVDSDIPFKIDYRLIRLKDTRESISKNANKVLRTTEYYGNTFEKFILTASDGTVFTFGGINAIDYSIGYYDQRHSKPVATTWHLTEILFINGIRYTFDYIEVPPIVDGDWSFIIPSDCSLAQQYHGRGLNFQLIMSVLLKSISSSSLGKIIEFEYEPSTELKYPKEYFKDFYTTTFPGMVYLDLIHYRDEDDRQGYMNVYIKDFSDLKWTQLSNIKILTDIEYVFDYTSSLTERLKLKSICKKSLHDLSKELYTFSYNSQKLPDYLSGHYDNLGFYNGKDFSNTFTQNFFKLPCSNIFLKEVGLFEEKRWGDISGKYVNAEILEKIQYPTGGYTTFEYEPHFVDSIIEINRQSLDYGGIPEYRHPGGRRISKIINYDANNKLLSNKKYYYLRGFHSKIFDDIDDDRSHEPSSGILSYKPNYLWPIHISNGANEYSKHYIFTSGSTAQSYFNLEESPQVGYSEVTECDLNEEGQIKGYTKLFYTSFAPNNYDTLPLVNLSEYSPSEISPYTPFSSNAKKRGHIKYKVIFDSDEKIKQETFFTYDSSWKKEIRNIISSKVDIHKQSLFTRKTYLGGSYISYIYNYVPVKERKIEYREGVKIEEVITFSYNSDGQLKKKVQSNSLGGIFTQSFKYPYDYPTDTGYKDLVSRNIISTPIEKVVTNNDQEISRTKKNYLFHTLGTIRRSLPSTVETSTIGQKGLQPILTYDKFNTSSGGYDNLLEYTRQDGIKVSYLWSYNNQYIIAEIINESYDNIINKLQELGISPEALDSADMTKIDALREKLANAQVTTYTYKPLVGMLTSTDPRGVTTYYDYDSFGRLKATYIKENGQKRIIQSYNYHYQNQ